MAPRPTPASTPLDEVELQRGAQVGHPFLSGNYAPQHREQPLTPCHVVHGHIPDELAGSQYVRNGGNAADHFDNERDAHWFDADGMLAGVYFKRADDGMAIIPHFVNRFILTDIHLATSKHARRAILPSIATLINPAVSFLRLTIHILRAVILVFATWLPGLWTGALAPWHDNGGKVKRISVANTSIWWHDRKALAGCESGPPIQIRLPELDTAAWWLGQGTRTDEPTKTWAQGPGLLKHFREYTTAHPKVDPVNGELIMYHMCFVAPFLRVSVIPSRDASPQLITSNDGSSKLAREAMLGKMVPGVTQPKLMHDFACTRTRTIILDLPLSLDPRNVLKGRPVMHYDARQVGRLGIFPRWAPDQVQWLDTREAFCVYHTANAWDDDAEAGAGADADVAQAGQGTPTTPAVNLLACRLNSATLAYVAGNVPPPPHVLPATQEREKCQLYYWRIEGGPAVEPTPAMPAVLQAHDRPLLEESSRPPSYQRSTTDAEVDDALRLPPSPPPRSPPPTYADANLVPLSMPPPPTSPSTTTPKPRITHEFALSEIPFEFPTLNRERGMQKASYIYGTSTRAACGLDARLAQVGTGAAKIDCLVKVDVGALIRRGIERAERGELRSGKAVDERSVAEILAQQEQQEKESRRTRTSSRATTSADDTTNDPIQIFAMPTGWYAQEATFVPRRRFPTTSSPLDTPPPPAEDEGYLLFYAFDELAHLDPSTGQCRPRAASELWILDARDMRSVVCRIALPQRVPYGLHGEWFEEAKVMGQDMVPALAQLEAEERREREREQARRKAGPQRGRRPASVVADAPDDGDEKTELVAASQRREPFLRRRYRGPPGEVDDSALIKGPPSSGLVQAPQGVLSRVAWQLRESVELWLQ